jgi:electron transfer flavoprotein beta subunit
MTIAVCWKWVSLDGDARWAGVSPADRAALETALVLAEATGEDVVAFALGPPDADVVLREALAAGAARAVRIDGPADLRSDAVARALAATITAAIEPRSWVVCGDYSLDRGSGAVPALLAAELGAAQALGLVRVDTSSARVDRTVHAVRRLDGGRREQLRVAAPAVLSVEGSVARLRRASLAAGLAARKAPVESVPGPGGPRDIATAVGPYRPRARILPPPTGADALERVRAITAAGAASSHGETVALDPPEAAARIVQALREWGYLDDHRLGPNHLLGR